ncbi:hypothetical protein F4678DRAFT_97883 [Xylaria arbuscula]|nr:hypothetical protein F4678DRAFT_97883 [Xylaria arbuscula]
MVTSLFEKLECLLGLPPHLRVTTRTGDLGAICIRDNFQDVIRSVVSRDEACKPENGKGGVPSLRKHMKLAMQLLRANIAP